MKRKAIPSFVLVVLFLFSVLPVRTLSGAADSHGGSGVFGSQPTARADSNNLTSSAPIPELSWTMGEPFPVINGHTIFPTLPPLVSPLDNYGNRWYAGSVYPPSSSTQKGSTICMSTLVPNSAPGSDELYYALLSVWDSNGSYDQIGFSAFYGTWGLVYSWTTGPPNDLTFHNSVDAMALSPGAVYKFNITTQNGVTDFVACQGSTPVWFLDAPTGGNYLILSNGFSGYLDYTDYEEVWKTHTPGGAPSFDFCFYNQYWVSTTGNGDVATWTSFLVGNGVAVPSGVTVSISGNSVLVENPGSVTLLWKLTVVSAHDSPNPSLGDNYYYDGSSVTSSVTSPVTEGSTVWTCTGWSGFGSVPSSGGGASVSFTITQDSSITWNWIAGERAYYSVEPIPISPLTDINGSLNGLETPATPSPVNLNFNVEIHLRNATSTNVPTGVSGVEVHFYFGDILNYCKPIGFANMLAQPGGVLVGSSILYGINAGFYDNADNQISASPYTNATQYMVAAFSTTGSWNNADGLVAEITFQIIDQPSSPQTDFYAPLQLTFVDLADANANSVPSYVIQGTVHIDASPAVPKYLVVRGADSRIYHKASLGDSWGDWNVLSGATCDSPAATVYQGQLCIVVRGMDGNTLWYGKLTNPTDPTSFSGWSLLDGSTNSPPTLASNGTVMCLVVRGLDNRIYYKCFTGSWGPWHAVPTGATGDSPAAAMLGNGLHIVVRGMDGRSLWDTVVSCDGTVIRGWSLLSGATPSKPVLTCTGADDLQLVVRGMDNRIYYRTYTNSTEFWGDWSAIPAGATNDGPAATVMSNVLCAVVRGMDGSSLWCGDIDLGTSSFTGWTLLSGATRSAPTLIC